MSIEALLEDVAALLERVAFAEERRNELLQADQAFRREAIAEDRRVMTERWEAISEPSVIDEAPTHD